MRAMAAKRHQADGRSVVSITTLGSNGNIQTLAALSAHHYRELATVRTSAKTDNSTAVPSPPAQAATTHFRQTAMS
jgi:hypothetical protein